MSELRSTSLLEVQKKGVALRICAIVAVFRLFAWEPNRMVFDGPRNEKEIILVKDRFNFGLHFGLSYLRILGAVFSLSYFLIGELLLPSASFCFSGCILLCFCFLVL